jgi:hypothetical protein
MEPYLLLELALEARAREELLKAGEQLAESRHAA